MPLLSRTRNKWVASRCHGIPRDVNLSAAGSIQRRVKNAANRPQVYTLAYNVIGGPRHECEGIRVGGGARGSGHIPAGFGGF